MSRDRLGSVAASLRPRADGDPVMTATKTAIRILGRRVLRALVDDVTAVAGPDGLLFPNASGAIIRRSNFQQTWIRAAEAADWPMTTPIQRTAGYGKSNKGWRWTGSAKWSPHDLRHVAACWMLFDLGLDPAVVADKLGHADPSFTMKALRRRAW